MSSKLAKLVGTSEEKKKKVKSQRAKNLISVNKVESRAKESISQQVSRARRIRAREPK